MTRYCSVNGCDREFHALDYCLGHYMQVYVHGKVVSVSLKKSGRKGKVFRRVKNEIRLCKVGGCLRAADYQCGHCRPHYLQIYRNGKVVKETISQKNGVV